MASFAGPSLPERPQVVDSSSLANHRHVRAIEAVWTAQLRFDTKTIDARAEFLFKCSRDLDGDDARVDLDTRALAIRGVAVNGRSVPFLDKASSAGASEAAVLRPEAAPFGRQLSIPLGRSFSTGESFSVSIDYSTTDGSTALQWLDAGQTDGKTQPFVFTQCQAIHARSLLPCPDTPAHKLTFKAFVAAPAPITVLMSALGNGGATQDAEAGWTAASHAIADLRSRAGDGASQLAGKEAEDDDDDDDDDAAAASGAGSSEVGAPLAGFSFREGDVVSSFDQPRPVPTYLIALAAGALEHRAITDTVGVWAEPGLVEASRKEFQAAPHFLSEAESLLGPYMWGRYDVLVMPPSFPYGGMENPCLTFATPTLLAGDGSLADVVAHEIMHSWSGNGFTCAAWEDFWLNEGFTMMGQRKVVGAVREKYTHTESVIKGDSFFAFDSYDGAGRLADELDALEQRGASRFTKLVPDMDGVDPDESFSVIPYEKGYHFLCFLQDKMGGKARFDPWLKAFTYAHMGKSITRFDFQDHVTSYFAAPANDGGEPLDMDSIVDWETWYYTEGTPPESVEHDGSVRDECEKLAGDFLTAPDGVRPGQLKAWANDAHLLIAFARRLAEIAKQLAAQDPPQRISRELLEYIDSESGLSKTGNCELRMAWTTVAMLSGLPGAVDQARDFLVSFGRMKYARPLLQLLAENADGGRAAAVQVVKEHADWYHPICGNKLVSDLERLLKQPARSPSDFGPVGVAPSAAAKPKEEPAAAEEAAPAAEEGAAGAGGGKDADEDDGLDDLLDEVELDDVVKAAQAGEAVPDVSSGGAAAGPSDEPAVAAKSTALETKSDDGGSAPPAAAPAAGLASLEPKAYEYGDDDYDGNDMEDSSEEESESEEESGDEESEEESSEEEEESDDDAVGNGETEALAALAKQMQASQAAAAEAAAENGDEDEDEEEEEAGAAAAGAMVPSSGAGGRGDSSQLRWAPEDMNKIITVGFSSGQTKRVRFGDLPPQIQLQAAAKAGIRPLGDDDGADGTQEAPPALSRSKTAPAPRPGIQGQAGSGGSSPARRGPRSFIPTGFGPNSTKSTFQSITKEERQTALPAEVKEMEAMGEEILAEQEEEEAAGVGGAAAAWLSPAAWLSAAGKMPVVPKRWQPAASKAIATTTAVVVVSVGVLGAIAVVDVARGKSPLESVKRNSWRFMVKPVLNLLSGKTEDELDPFEDDPFAKSTPGAAAPLSRQAGGGGGGQ